MKHILFFILIVSNLSIFGQQINLKINNYKVEQYIKRHIDNLKFNGNLLISKGDSIVYHNSFGLANREQEIDNNDSTKFLIGSITKTFTALGILILEEEKKLKLSDKLSEYFPEFQSADKITIDQLLTHTSGISDYRIFADWKEDSKSDQTTPYTTVAKMSDQPLLFEPGAKFGYSNVGYILLGLIIEKTSKVSFENFIQEKILDPLELKNTGVINNQTVVSNLANGYKTNPRETLKAEYINYKQPFTSGNMYSTTYDLLKFTTAVMAGSLISTEKTKEIFESGEYYGYGWGIRNFAGIRAYGHFGGMNGFVGSCTYIPEGKYFICFLTNNDNTPKVRITTDLIAILQGQDISLPDKTQIIDLSEKMRNRVIGNYKIKNKGTLHIFNEDGKLYLQENNQEKHEMFAYENYKFSFELLEFNVVFENLKDDKTQLLKFVGRDTILSADRIKVHNKK